MKLLCMSDIHCEFDRFAADRLPDADLCIVAGDLTNGGNFRDKHSISLETWAAREWLDSLGRRFPVFWIPGNHDFYIDGSTPLYFPPDRARHPIVCLYRHTETFRGLRFRGVSCCPCYDAPNLAQWAYSTIDPEEENRAYDLPPVDVLISHCPPHTMLDSTGLLFDPDRGGWHPRRIGSVPLHTYILKHQPRLVVCGHCHEDGGKETTCAATRVINVAQTWKVVEI